jgi:uncharacterized protein YkwD
MNWGKIALFLLLGLFAGGFLPSNRSFWTALIPDCRSSEFSRIPEAKGSGSEGADEQELLAITNRDRLERGLPPLTFDKALMQIAREHAMGMAQQGFISHDQPSGDLQTRMRRYRYYYETARENVASARTVLKAHEALLNSPKHKDNILAADVTRIGIGIAQYPSLCDKHLYITEVFATPLEIYDLSTVQDFLINRVKELSQPGAGEMHLDPLLDKIASRSLDSLSVPYNQEELRSLLSASARELQENGKNELARLQVVVQLIRNPKNLNIPATIHHNQDQMYATAVRPIFDDQNHPAFIVLTLIGNTRPITALFVSQSPENSLAIAASSHILIGGFK